MTADETQRHSRLDVHEDPDICRSEAAEMEQEPEDGCRERRGLMVVVREGGCREVEGGQK